MNACLGNEFELSENGKLTTSHGCFYENHANVIGATIRGLLGV